MLALLVAQAGAISLPTDGWQWWVGLGPVVSFIGFFLLQYLWPTFKESLARRRVLFDAQIIATKEERDGWIKNIATERDARLVDRDKYLSSIILDRDAIRADAAEQMKVNLKQSEALQNAADAMTKVADRVQSLEAVVASLRATPATGGKP